MLPAQTGYLGFFVAAPRHQLREKEQFLCVGECRHEAVEEGCSGEERRGGAVLLRHVVTYRLYAAAAPEIPLRRRLRHQLQRRAGPPPAPGATASGQVHQRGRLCGL